MSGRQATVPFDTEMLALLRRDIHGDMGHENTLHSGTHILIRVAAIYSIYLQQGDKMIDEQRTLEIYGYTNSELAPSSNKRIVVVCDECGRIGTPTKCNYKNKNHPELCNVCSRSKEYNVNWKGGGVALICEWCDDVYHVGKYREHISRFCSYKCRDAWASENVRGDNCPAWKGGVTPDSIKFRMSSKCRDWRIAVFERDDYTCQECGRRGGGKLNAHHILPYGDWKDPGFSLNIKNGITLCEDCHRETFGREYEFFNKYFDIVNEVNN